MDRKMPFASKHIPAKAVMPLPLVLLGLLFTGCFQGQEEPSARGRTSADISSLSRPFSFGTPGKASATKREDLQSLPGLLVESERLGTGIMIFDGAGPFPPQGDGQTGGTEFGMFLKAPSGNWDLAGLDATRSRVGSTTAPSRMTAAALYLDRPFSSLFAGLFNQGKEEAGTGTPNAAATRDETAANPFTEARQKAEASTPPAKAAHEDLAPAKEDSSSKSASTDTSPDPSQAQPVGAAARPLYVFLGDFDGTGQLQAVDAERLGETTFLFPDATRDFRFFVNPSAVESQRSFGVEDMNGDGLPDLIATSRSNLFGGLLLGNPDGSYTVSDTFLTGYEPVVATAGPVDNGRRDIVTVDVRTGEVSIFRPQPQYRRGQNPFSLGYIPDLICHMVGAQTSGDFFMAGQAGGMSQSFSWNKEHNLIPTDASVPVVPSISLDRDFLRKNAASTVQVYQVGSYASITLANSRHQSFNVANLRVRPQIFIAIGTFAHAGTLDVAVGFLRVVTPK